MQFTDFEETGAITKLLNAVGVSGDLVGFLADHLPPALPERFRGARIESVKYLGSATCSAGGMSNADGSVVVLDSLQIPVNARIFLLDSLTNYELDVCIRIIATSANGEYDVVVDVSEGNYGGSF